MFDRELTSQIYKKTQEKQPDHKREVSWTEEA